MNAAKGSLVDRDATAIGALYEKSRSGIIESVRYLLQCGARLAKKKEELGHGNWLPWLKAIRREASCYRRAIFFVANPFIVCEVGGNHLGSQARAIQLIDAAVRCGADAVKFQCFTPEQMADPGVIVQSGPWTGQELLALYKQTWTPREWFPLLFAHARASHIIPFASVFHRNDVDFLETLGCEMFKISSFEILDLPLIRHAAKTGKPLAISVGMAEYDEIENAVNAADEIQMVNGGKLTLLKCVSAYPTALADCNLTMIPDLRESFASDVGLSDHTLGSTAAVVAVGLGAVMVEKHLTLSRADGGPDSGFSSEPHEFKAMVDACREAAAALGEVRYGPTPSEMSSLPLRRKPGGKRGG